MQSQSKCKMISSHIQFIRQEFHIGRYLSQLGSNSKITMELKLKPNIYLN